jgi:hypothetical protein
MAQVSQKQRRPAPANFLEALRDLSKGVVDEVKIQVTTAITSDIPQSLGISGTLEPNKSFSMADLKSAEQSGERKAEARFSNRLQEEKIVWLRAENESKAQVKSIQEEIQLMAKSVGELAHEVQIASFQAPANPGVYHKSFFSRLRSYIQALRVKVQESKHWLATQNARASKRSHYWGQVQKSGTKFMLSQERYMVTSTG